MFRRSSGTLPELQKLARDSAGIADPKITSVVVLKPKREFGDNEMEWRIAVEAGNAPTFPNPNSPTVPRATAIFDTKGALLRTKFPRGEGPKVDLLDPPELKKAFAVIAARLGPHLKTTELVVTPDEIEITAQDPKKPESLGAFAYRDQEIKRETGARATIANSMGSGPARCSTWRPWSRQLRALSPPCSGKL